MFTRGLAVAGTTASLEYFWSQTCGRAAVVHGIRLTGRLQSPPRPAAAPSAPRPGRRPHARCAGPRHRQQVEEELTHLG